MCGAMQTVPPIEFRKLRAEMELKALSLTAVAKKARVKSLSRASEVLNGRRNDSEVLAKLTKAIHQAPMPQEEAA